MYRVGAPSFSNTLPIAYPLTHGIISHDFNFTFGEPTYVNRLLDEDVIEIGLISAYHYLANTDRYSIFSSYGIGASDNVMSVCLFLNHEIKDFHKKTILVPTSSATSINLLKVLAHFYWDIEIECKEVDTKTIAKEDLEKEDGFLLIGDEALLYRNSFSTTCIDLATEWYNFTGKKFIFALFAINKKNLQIDEGSFSEKISQALNWSKNHKDTIIQQAQKKLDLPKETISCYFDVLQYELSQDHFDGLELFYSYLNSGSFLCNMKQKILH